MAVGSEEKSSNGTAAANGTTTTNGERKTMTSSDLQKVSNGEYKPLATAKSSHGTRAPGAPDHCGHAVQLRHGDKRGAANKLFTPLRIAAGRLELQHRVVYCPMTRLRGMPLPDTSSDDLDRAWYPDDLHAEYYGQRATAGGLLISEGITTSQQATGLPFVPGIWLPEQVDGWKKVTAAVHARQGFIYAQLWHSGRVTVPQWTGAAPVSSTGDPWGADDCYPFPIPSTGELVKYKDHPPQKLDAAGIARVIAEMVHAARCAMAAGFDGIEIHGANGYLPEQFLASNINTRDDAFGGSAEKRPKFILDLIAALGAAIGSHNVGIRLSPFGLCHQSRCTERFATWGALCRGIMERPDIGPISYVHFIEPRWEQLHSLEEKTTFLASFGDEPTIAPFKRILSPTPIISAGGWNPDNCWDEVEEDRADALAFGRLFLANPDFVARMRQDLPLNMYHRPSFYMGRAVGYTDYPAYDEAKKQNDRWWGEPEELDPNEYMEEL